MRPVDRVASVLGQASSVARISTIRLSTKYICPVKKRGGGGEIFANISKNKINTKPTSMSTSYPVK